MKRNALITNKGFLFLILTTLFLGFMNEGFGQSIWTNPINSKNPDPSADNPYRFNETFDTNITVSGIGRGIGISPSNGDERYNAKGWVSSTFDPDDYFTFSLMPKLGYQINLTNFNFTGQVSDTGPTKFAFRSSLDNFSTDIWAQTATLGLGTNIMIVLTNPAYQNISTPIEYRIYAWGATHGSGTFSINDFTFIGTISKSTIDFDGIDDYVDFGDKHGFTSPFSLEAWVLQKATVASGTIISKGDVKISNKRGYHLSLNNIGKPNLTWYNISGSPILNITSPNAIPTDKWHHIAATYDGTVAKLFIDGLEVATGTPSGSTTNGTEKFLIGAMYDSGTPTVPKNYFKGYIDEVRIWNTALTTQQIREMMNQEIEINGTFVKGKVIPLNISGGLLWANLVGYYPMNDETANDESGNAFKIVGAPKNMTTSQLQTAPLPYVSNANGTWDTNTTWLNGTVQNLPNTEGVGKDINDNDPSHPANYKAPINWNIVITKHNINNTKGHTVLGLITDANSTLTVKASDSLRITNYLKLIGKIDLEGESQLLQDEGSVFDGTGSIEIDQQGTSDHFRYNYWGSPVISSIGGTNYTIAGVLRDGTFPNKIKAISFGSAYTYADVDIDPIDIATTSIKLSTYWMYKFVNSGNGYGGWTSVGKDKTLEVGEGFTMKGSNTTSTEQNYTFVGKPNNGNINLDIDPGRQYLIGNPYPSAIDAKQFIRDNINKDVASNTGNRLTNIIDGNLYFWDHFGGGTHYLKSYEGGYAIYNLSAGAAGGVRAVSNDPRINNSGKSDFDKAPQRFIPVAQGFFVTALDGGEIRFKNSQRFFKKESLGNSQFLKSTGKAKSSKETVKVEDVFPRIYLNYSSPKGFQRQLLVAFIPTTTDGIDIGYDAVTGEKFVEDMAWIANDKKLVIQAVPTLNDQRILPIYLKLAIGGIAKIGIDALENMPKGTNIFIKDNITNESIDITEKSFEMMLDAGEYTDRFEMTFKIKLKPDENAFLMDEDILVNVKNPLIAEDVSMVQNEKLIDKGVHVFMNNAIGEIQIKNNSDDEIISIVLYNYLGQTIKTWNANFNIRTISLPIKIAMGVYVTKISTKNKTFIRKILIR